MVLSDKPIRIARLMLVAGITLLTVACAFRGEFREAQPRSPYALLTADKGVSWRDRGPTVFAINSQPTSFWKAGEKFRLPPGDTVWTVIADRAPYGFRPLRFTALQGRHYHLRYGDGRRSVVLYDVTNATKTAIISVSPREGSSPGSEPRGETQGEQAAASDGDKPPI